MDLRLPDGTNIRHTVRGTAVAWGKPPAIVQGGYALTSGVPKEFADEWFSRNKGLDMVRDKLLFAMPNPVEARALSKELTGAKTGFEPMDPDKPGRGLERMTDAPVV